MRGDLMAVPWGLVVFVIGIVYGWLSPGRQNKWALFKTGALIGIVLALVFALLGFLIDANPLGMGGGFLGFIVSFLILTLLFVIGVWIGDLLERAFSPGRRRVA